MKKIFCLIFLPIVAFAQSGGALVSNNGQNWPNGTQQVLSQGSNGALYVMAPPGGTINPIPVTVSGSGGSTTANQGTPNTAANGWPVYLEFGGIALPLGQSLSAASVPVVLPAAQVTALTPPTSVSVTQATASNLNAQVQGIGTAGAPNGGVISVQSVSQLPTYYVYGTAYTAYATPTDLMCLNNAGTNIIYLDTFTVTVQSTATAFQEMFYIRRSAADTGGTPTAATVNKADLSDVAPTATFTLYGSAPTVGAAVATFDDVQFSSTASATSAGAAVTFAGRINWPATSNGSSTNTVVKPITMRSGESVCLNFNGAVLPAGETLKYYIRWSENP